MQSKKHLIKVGLLLAIIIACGIFLWQASAGVWKFDSTKSTVAKINTQQVGRWTGGLVGYWTFDGQDTNWTANTVADKSGSNNTGTIVNMSTTTSPQPGKIGQAMKFDGVSSYVNVSPSSSLEPTKITVTAWLKPMAGSGSYYYSYEPKGSSADGRGLRLAIDSTTNFRVVSVFGFGTGAWHYCITDIGSITLGNIIFVVFTFDQTYAKVYINGVLAKTANEPGTISWTDNPVPGTDEPPAKRFFIGKDRYITTDYVFSGLIDEMRVYNRALSAGEIEEMYNAGVGTHIKP